MHSIEEDRLNPKMKTQGESYVHSLQNSNDLKSEVIIMLNNLIDI